MTELTCDGAKLAVSDWNEARNILEELQDGIDDLTSKQVRSRIDALCVILKCQ